MRNGNDRKKIVSLAELLAAELVLGALVGMMADDFKANGHGWDRDLMQKHAEDRAAFIRTRNVLINFAEAANGHGA